LSYRSTRNSLFYTLPIFLSTHRDTTNSQNSPAGCPFLSSAQHSRQIPRHFPRAFQVMRIKRDR